MKNRLLIVLMLSESGFTNEKGKVNVLNATNYRNARRDR